MSDGVAADAPGREPALRQRVVHALAWTLSGRVLAQATSWLATLFVIRLLAPDDYGLMALATIFVTLVALVNELGMSGALIQADRLTEAQIRQTYGLIIVVQLAFTFLIVAAATPIALFFEDARLAPILQVSSLQFIFLAFEIIPESLLMRALDFRRKTYIDTAAQLAGSLSTLALAWLGHGVWALVWGVLANQAVKAVGFPVMTRFYVWPSFSLRGMRAIISFGGLLTAERVFWFLYSQADNLILGKRFGGEVLGIYSVAIQLAALPMDKLGPIIGQVAFPAFARVQQRPAEATAYLLKATRLIALVSFPTMFGLSAVAPWFVPVVLGPKWHAAILPLQLLALSMPLRFIALAQPPFLKGLGYARLSLTNTMLAFVVLPLAFLIGSRWGVVGVCVAWLVAYPPYFVLTVLRTGRVTPLTLGGVLRALAPSALAAGAMHAAVSGAGAILPPGAHPIVALVALIGLGTLVYGALALIFHRDTCREAADLMVPASWRPRLGWR
jgi:O-antigen/teichoic acid export membrane protein